MLSTRSPSYWTAACLLIHDGRSRQDWPLEPERLGNSWCLSVLCQVGCPAGTRIWQVESEAPVRPPVKIYLIDNSLAWDALPGLLDGDVQWHVDWCERTGSTSRQSVEPVRQNVDRDRTKP
ncbi:MAG: hypothetical protein R3C56_18245 [Pirellulaceae bacterium]